MSPARSRRQAQVAHRRDRNDIVKAVLVSAAIVAVTVFLVWMLRPGPTGVPATGGIMNRQPRASWLVFGAIVVGFLACWMILRGNVRWRRRAKIALPIALVIVLLGAVAIGVAWPGGLLRHDVAPTAQPQPEPTTTPTTPAPTTPAPTGATGATGPTGATGTSGASGGTGTTQPSTTAPR